MSTQGQVNGVKPAARSRPTRQAAAQHRYADMKVDGEEYLYEEQPYVNGGSQEPATRIDLNKMKVQTLRKYSKAYELPGIHPQSSKEDLTNAVTRHWNTVAVSEESVLQNLLRLRPRNGDRY